MFGPTAEVEMAAYDKMFASNVRAPLFSSGRWLPGWSSAAAAASSA
jgi:hypothetical protein